MHRHHPDAKFRGCSDGAGDLMRDVVEFQIEKHAMAEVDEAAYERRSLGGKQRASHLEPADTALKPRRQLERVDAVVHVESD